MPKKGSFVREYTTTTGTGTITLGGRYLPDDMILDDVLDDGEEVVITIRDGDSYEVSQGVFTSSGTTVTRARIIETYDGSTFTRYPGAGLNLSGFALVTTDYHHKVPDLSMPSLLTVSGANWLPSQAPGIYQGSSSKTLVADRFYYCPFFNAQTFSVTGIGCYVGTAVAFSNIRMYIYSIKYDATNGIQPDYLIQDAGAISSATTGDKQLTFSAIEVPPWSIVGVVSDSANVAVRAYADTAAGPGPFGFSQARPVLHGFYDGTYGAPADPANAISGYGTATTTPTMLLRYTQ